MLTLREHSAPKLKGKLTLRKVSALVMLTLRSLKLKGKLTLREVFRLSNANTPRTLRTQT